jgi:hypothetical protein
MLHFLLNSPDKVYMGICNWAMAKNYNDLKESLYIQKNEDTKSRII